MIPSFFSPSLRTSLSISSPFCFPFSCCTDSEVEVKLGCMWLFFLHVTLLFLIYQLLLPAYCCQNLTFSLINTWNLGFSSLVQVITAKILVASLFSSLHPAGIYGWFFFSFIVSNWSYKSLPLGSFLAEVPGTFLLYTLDKCAQLVFQLCLPVYLFPQELSHTWCVRWCFPRVLLLFLPFLAVEQQFKVTNGSC